MAEQQAPRRRIGTLPLLLVLFLEPGALAVATIGLVGALRQDITELSTALLVASLIALLLPTAIAMQFTGRLRGGARFVVTALLTVILQGGAVFALMRFAGVTPERMAATTNDLLALAGIEQRLPVATAPAAGEERASEKPKGGKGVEGTEVTRPIEHVEGTLYEWVDASGSLYITDSPPPVGSRLIETAEPAEKREPEAAERPPSPTPTARPIPTTPAVKEAQLTRSLKIGDFAPAMSGVNALGNTVHLRELIGKPVWLAFSSTSCGACVREAADLAEVEKKLRGRAAFVTPLFTSAAGDASEWASRFGLDPAGVLAMEPSQFPRGGVPWNVLLDHNGRVVEIRTGGVDVVEIERLVRKLL